MKRANVVQNVRCALTQHEENDQKVEPPQHLQYPDQRVVTLDVEEGKIAEASHPNVACNHNANAVVHLPGTVVVIKEEDELHPTLPLLRLISVQHIVGFYDLGDRLYSIGTCSAAGALVASPSTPESSSAGSSGTTSAGTGT